MAEPMDMIVPMLRELRAENKALHGETLAGFDRVEQRLQKLEEAQVAFKEGLTAKTLFSRLAAAKFEGRIGALEAKVGELEAQR